jgi:hypothetical protein
MRKETRAIDLPAESVSSAQIPEALGRAWPLARRRHTWSAQLPSPSTPRTL